MLFIFVTFTEVSPDHFHCKESRDFGNISLNWKTVTRDKLFVPIKTFIFHIVTSFYFILFFAI